MIIPPKLSVLLLVLLGGCQAQPPPAAAPAEPSPTRGVPPPAASSASPVSSPSSVSSSSSASPASSASSQWHGDYGGSEQFAVRVLRTASEWEAFWRQVRRGQPRSLDVAREMAVAVSLGERRTGGYRVEIVGVQPQERKLVVTYREITPAPDMMVTQALTTPWAVAVVPRSDLPVEPRPLADAGRQSRE